MADGGVRLVDPEPSTPQPPQRRPALAVVPLPDPRRSVLRDDAPETSAVVEAPRELKLQVLCCGLSQQRLEEAVRCHGWPVSAVDDLACADVLLSVRRGLGRQPELRRQAREAGVPILVIKSDSLAQVERALERLLNRQPLPKKDQEAERSFVHPDRGDAMAALEECRLAVEQIVMPQGRPVELLPRNENVLQMQADLVARYSLQSDVYGSSDQRRLRVFPP